MKKITKQDALPQIPRRKRVAAYTRVSRDSDAMRHSLSAQISYYNDLIQKRIDWEFAGVYPDYAETGTKEKRPEFQRMLADCRAGKIDMVITKSVTRFARNTVTTLASVRELKLLNVDVYFEKERIHSMSGDGELMLSILASYAQEESRSASENVKWRMRKMFQEGRPIKTRMMGYILLDGRYCVVPEEAEIVRQIFADYLGGMGLMAIAKKLHKAGVKTLFDSTWRKNTIAAILGNDTYTGSMTLQKTFVSDHISKKKCVNRGELPMYFVENSHEAIVNKATFEAAQTELRRRSHIVSGDGACGRATTIFPFTGLIRCCKCGAPYKRKHANAGSKYEKIVWICDTFDTLGKNDCDSQQIPENILMAKTAEVLGLEALDEAVLREKIKTIQVPGHNQLIFIFKSGLSVETEWQHPSRRDSWTPEMRQAARERQLRHKRERRTEPDEQQ